MLYAMALGTGFRAGELRSLTRESFDLDKSTVTLAARHSKHRRADIQPLPPWLLEWLRTWFAEDRPLWPDLTPHTAKMIRADLEAAGIPYVVERVDGRKFADFHALRHTFASEVARTVAPVKDMMEVTRHSTPQLFFNVYAKTTTENKARCVTQLADPLANAQEPIAMTD